jgi:hypothetical protein
MEFVFTIGMSALIGVALGFRFSVFVLIPTIILAGVSTAVIEAATGELWSIVLTVVLVVTTLQISYLAGSIMRAALEKRVLLDPLRLAADAPNPDQSSVSKAVPEASISARRNGTRKRKTKPIIAADTQ